LAGIGKRLLDLARANLNALLDRTADAALDDFSDEELQAELELRQARKRREEETRAAREAAERAARERARERASRTGPDAASQQRASRSQQTPRRSPPPSSGLTDEQRTLARLYAKLETPYGADFETVRRNFRRLVRLHHPDLAAGADKQRATERTAELTQAYNELERLLAKR